MPNEDMTAYTEQNASRTQARMAARQQKQQLAEKAALEAKEILNNLDSSEEAKTAAKNEATALKEAANQPYPEVPQLNQSKVVVTDITQFKRSLPLHPCLV